MSLLSALPLLLALPAGDIAWQASLEEAQAKAASEGKVVFLAANMDGEPANERMAGKVYHDPRIVELSGHAICLIASASDHGGSEKCRRFGSIPCSDHRRVDSAARKAILKADAEGYVIAPQHVFLDAAGQVIFSVPYEISAAELEWCLATACKKQDPSFSWSLSAGARAPHRLIDGGVYDPEGADGGSRLPTREEVLELISEVKKGMQGAQRMQSLFRILSADEPEAIDFVQAELRRGNKGGGGDLRAEILHAMGARSPASYWEVVADFLDDGSPLLRSEAAAAMEQIAAAGAARELGSLFAKEKDPVLQRDLLRALASCGAEDPKVRDKVLRIAAKEKESLLRLNAILALGHFPPADPEVRKLLEQKLAEGEPEEQAAAACAMAFTRDPSWLPLFEGRLPAAAGTIKQVLEVGVGVLRDGKLAPLGELFQRLSQDKIRRERFFGRISDR